MKIGIDIFYLPFEFFGCYYLGMLFKNWRSGYEKARN